MSDPAKETEQEVQTPVTEENWVDHLKHLLFAGLGAVAMAQEEVEVLVKKLVQKGTIAEQEGRKWIKEVWDKGCKQTKDKVNTIENRLENVEEVFKKYTLPSKAQFEKLSKEVEELRKKVEELCNKLQ